MSAENLVSQDEEPGGVVALIRCPQTLSLSPFSPFLHAVPEVVFSYAPEVAFDDAPPWGALELNSMQQLGSIPTRPFLRFSLWFRFDLIHSLKNPECLLITRA